MESRSLRFAAAARTLSEAARAAGHVAPGFRSPPRVPGRMRTIRHHADGGATVSLVVRDRPWSAVLADMIEGFVVVNDIDADRAAALRDLLWSSIEVIDLVDPPAPASRRGSAGTEGVGSVELRIVDAA